MPVPGNICDNCNFKFQLEPVNTVIYYFEAQPWFSFGNAICPKCNYSSRLFWREGHMAYLEHFILGEFGFITEEFAAPDVVKAFEDVYGLHTLPEHELTPRMEKEIAELSEWLLQAPDEWVEAMFAEAAPPPDRPETWC